MKSLRLVERAQANASDPLLRSAYSLMLSVVVTAPLGIAFWALAARLYPPEELGRDAALIAAMVELSTICQLNLANVLTRFLPSLTQGTARALSGAYGAAGAAALVVAPAFILAAPLTSDEFAFLRDDPSIAVLYVLAQVAWGWFVLQDAALTAVRRAPWVPIENGAFGLLKLAALPMFLAIGAHGIFLAWVLPVVVLLVPVNIFLFRTAIPEHLRSQRPSGSVLERLGRRRLISFMAQDYGASIVARGATTLLPLFIVALLGSSANAYFYIPFTIVVAFDMVFYSASASLVAEGALAENQIRALAQRLVRRFAFILVPGTALIIAAAPLIMLPFGEDYVRTSTSVLRVLACSCLFRAAIVLYAAIARLRGRGLQILAVETAQVCLLLGGAAAMADPFGLEGVALAWVGSAAIVALAVLPSLVRFFRSPPMNTPAEAVASSSDEVALP